MLLEITKKFPKQGQKIEFEKYLFTVMELGQFRIKRVKVKLPDKTKKND